MDGTKVGDAVVGALAGETVRADGEIVIGATVIGLEVTGASVVIIGARVAGELVATGEGFRVGLSDVATGIDVGVSDKTGVRSGEFVDVIGVRVGSSDCVAVGLVFGGDGDTGLIEPFILHPGCEQSPKTAKIMEVFSSNRVSQ